MGIFSRLLGRLLPALLMASSVTLLTVGVFNWAPPTTLGEVASPTPTTDAGNPIFPSPAVATPTPTTPSGSAGPTPTPRVTPSAGPTPVYALPTRIVIPSLAIDLAVMEGITDYPLCDVAQYLTGFSDPGEPGTTYLYAHARRGMFLPLLEQSETNDGAGMIGALVEVYTADSQLHLYEINIVKRHATDLTLAYQLEPGEHRLIMQTSEGPGGHIPKLQVAAKPIAVYPATPEEALPSPEPRVCQ